MRAASLRGYVAWLSLAGGCAVDARPPSAVRDRDASIDSVDAQLLTTDAPLSTRNCTDETCGHAGQLCGPWGDGCDDRSECRDGFCVACPASLPTVCSGRCTNLGTDRLNCGRCGATCVTVGCVAGQTTKCGRCDAGYADCDGDCANGCETSVSADPCNCGGCGIDCDAAPWVTGARCGGCACVITACAPGHADCDRIPSNGCETDIARDTHACGQCRQKCLDRQVCRDGACVFPAGQTLTCNGGYVDALYDPLHCGGCGNLCPDGTRCSNGACVNGCAPVTERLCDDRCAVLSSDPFNCGACGVYCDTGVCTEGRCDDRCPAGRTRCGLACVDLSSHYFHCGDCGVRCATGERCVAGRCVRPSCHAGTS